MDWKDRIPGSFGSEDKKFASHYYDCERAVKLLEEANKANVGLKEYLTEIENWLRSKGCDDEHIHQEIENVKNIASYFKHD